MKKLILLMMVSLFVFTGCASMKPAESSSPTSTANGQTIIGSWVGRPQRGEPVDMIFNADGTFKGSQMGGFPTQFTCKYTVDYATDPISVDLYGFDNISTARSLLPDATGNRGRGGTVEAGTKYLGIIRFIDDKTAEITGVFESTGTRPKEFKESVMTLLL